MKDSFPELLKRISSDLNQDFSQYVLPELISRFSERADLIAKNHDEILNANRDLKLGIVGEVKAGKSSFINALIFNGEDVLPKADTPMTATLTRISYAAQNEAEVTFFSHEDWEQIGRESAAYESTLLDMMKKWETDYFNQNPSQGLKIINESPKQCYERLRFQIPKDELKRIEESISETLKACHDIYTKYRDSPLLSKLGERVSFSFNEAKEELQDYVGSEGKFTPIVSYMQLKIKNDLLKGIEIVDTPGLGDPLASRCRQTTKFLMNCDAVFLLSFSSQYLSDSDMQLIMERLPQNSVAQLELVGTKFDSVLMDERGSGPIRKVYFLCGKKLTDRVIENLSKGISRSASEQSKKLMLRLLDSIKKSVEREKIACFTSALMYSAGSKKERNEPLDKLEEHVIKQLKRFEGMSDEPDFLKSFSGIGRFKNSEFEKLRSIKDQIIKERTEELVHGQVETILEILTEIQQEAGHHLQLLMSVDLDQIKTSLDKNRKAISSMSRDISAAFKKCANDTRGYLVKITNRIKSSSSNYLDLNVKAEQHDEHHSDSSGWWLWKKTTHWTETITDNVVSLGDVENSISEYIHEAERIYFNDIIHAVDIDSIKNNIKNIALSAFTIANTEFDPNDILGPVDLCLSKIQIPPFNLADPSDYIDSLIKEFPSARILNEDIDRLKHSVNQTFNNITKDICTKVENLAKNIESMLNTQASTFTDDLQSALTIKAQQLEESLNDKQSNIKRLNELMQRLVEQKKSVLTFGETNKHE